MRALRTRLRSGTFRRQVSQSFHDNLNARREQALALILDERAYVYPDPEPHKSQVQGEVDGLVAAVDEAHGARMALLQAVDGIDDVLGRIREIEEYLPYCGQQPDETADAVVQTLFGDDDIKDLGVVAEQDRSVLEGNERVAREIRLTAEEERCVRSTNDYRIRMGLRPLRIHPMLVQAARLHSVDMRDNGYFSHTGRDGSDPGQRSARQGYTGSAAGENIHSGSGCGQGAFEGWRHSSGHHRNMLESSWTAIGVGQADTVWTMVLGAGG